MLGIARSRLGRRLVLVSFHIRASEESQCNRQVPYQGHTRTLNQAKSEELYQQHQLREQHWLRMVQQ
jgi:hypothetical protein